MYRRIDDFLKVYENLTQSTSRIFDKLTDDNLNQSVEDDHRILGQIAWHIVVTVPEMMSKTDLTVSSIDHDLPPPKSAAEIVEGYKKVTEELIKALKASWSNETLEQTDEMYGQQWPRGMTLTALVNHEIHHRGQMTILLRQAGQKVPGVFGPAKEEWSQYGMDAPPY